MADSDIARARGIATEVVYRLRTELGEAPESIERLAETQLQRAIEKLEYPDRALRRIEHELGQLLDDRGEIGEGALAHAQVQAFETRERQPPGLVCGMPAGSRQLPTSDAAVAPEAGLVASAGWTALGPTTVGGRTRAIVVNPDDTDVLFAASVGGGVWRSLDAGKSWAPAGGGMGNLAVASLVMDPTDSSTLFAGTGEGFSNIDALRGDGIFTSTDGGTTWASVASTAANRDFFYVNSLAMSPDGTTLLAGTTTGIFRSTDAGASWTRVSDFAIGNLAFDPDSGAKAIAGGLRDTTALFSTDGGATWSLADRPSIAAGRVRVQVCYAAADPSVTYALADVRPTEIWRSSDGGRTYSRRDTMSGGVAASFLGQQGWYDNVIWAGDPTNQDLVVVGGIDLWRSRDGGNNLEQFSTWQSRRSAHADHHAVVADPGYDGITNRRVYFGNDGGIYRADDLLTVGNEVAPPYVNGWVNLNNGYAVTQFYYGAGHAGTSTIMGGAQDNGTWRYTPAAGPEGWNQVFGGDGGACASDPSDPRIWYGEYVNLNIFRNTDGGASSAATQYISGRYWNGSMYAFKPPPFSIPDAQTGNAQFIAPFRLDPNDPGRLLAGGLSLWLTTDPLTPNTDTTGPSWTEIKPAIGPNRFQDTITALAIADGDSDAIVVGHANGNIYRTTDGTAAAPQWRQIDTNGINANRQCLALAFDPDDHDVVYAAFGGFQPDNLWKTTDGGQIWADIAGTLPDAPIRAITTHPQRSSWVYVGTEVGIFASEDGGGSWSATNEGPADVACHDLFWMGSELVVATHGRGMFRIDLVIANAFPAPRLSVLGSEDFEAGGASFTRYNLEVTNWADYPSSLFRPSPDLPPCGLTGSASRTWADIFDAATDQRIYGFCALASGEDLRRIWFAMPRGTAPPKSVYVVLRDRRCNQTYASGAVNPSGAAGARRRRRARQ